MSLMPINNDNQGILGALADIASKAGIDTPETRWITVLGLGLGALNSLFGGNRGNGRNIFEGLFRTNKGNQTTSPNEIVFDNCWGTGRTTGTSGTAITDKDLIKKWGTNIYGNLR